MINIDKFRKVLKKTIITQTGKILSLETLHENKPERKAILIGHGRTALIDYMKFSVHNRVSVPPKLAVSFYTKEFGTLTNTELIRIALSLIQGRSVKATDKYKPNTRFQNYVIRPDRPFPKGSVVPSCEFDIIYPNDVMHIEDVLQLLGNAEFAYTHLHVLSCRGLRLTYTSC